MRPARCLPALASLLLAAAAAGQTIPDDTGLTALIQRLGAGNQPTGVAVIVGQTEAPGPGIFPDPNHPEFFGKTFTNQSPTGGVSGHSTTVGQHFYGLSTSIAPGVTDIRVWEAGDWLGPGFLNGITNNPPDPAEFKVSNHSWIGSGGGAQKSLRKLDYAIETQQLVVCVGVNNGLGRLDVPLLSHAFNLIAVGRSDGQHHSGPTGLGIDGPGRHKPEIVAPAGATSFSTPLIAGAGALMVETARTHPLLFLDPDAERADLIKAVLLAGATHRPGWTNNAPASGPLRGSTTTPMDDKWGTDQVNVDKSHWILTGAAQAGSATLGAAATVPHAGWDAVDIGSGEQRYWRFEVLNTQPYVSALVAWNRRVDPVLFASYQMPDLDLELWRLDSRGQPQTLVGDPGLPYFAAGNVQSISPVENVEHLYLNALAPGEYALELRRSSDGFATWTAAVAWELDCPDPFAYGTGKVTSLGQVPKLRWRGIPNVAVDDFVLEVEQAVPNNLGLVFWGHGQASIPFMGGTLLVQPPVTRMPAVTLGAGGAATIPVRLSAPMAGDVRNFQFWFRDPAHPDGTGAGLSDAVEVTFCY